MSTNNTIPEQVLENQENIDDNKELQDAVNLEMDERNQEQDDDIEGLQSDIEIIEGALASGGVIVTRKNAPAVDTIFPVVETKLDLSVEVVETNEVTVITKDANNDHILITDGRYSISCGLVFANTSAQARTATFRIIAKDVVTLTETIIDTITINLSASETVNTFPQVDYDKISVNNILIYATIIGEIQVTLKSTSYVHALSTFTVAGSGVVTKSSNIAPDSAVDEGVDEDELTIAEIFENIKSILIEKDVITGHTNLKREGVKFIEFLATSIKIDKKITMDNNLITDVADPVSLQDVVTKAFLNKLIQYDGTDTLIKLNDVSYIKLKSTGEINLLNRSLQGLLDPVFDQDANTKKYTEDNFVAIGEDVVVTAGTNITLNSGDVRVIDVTAIMTVNFSTTGVITADDVILTIPVDARPSILTMCKAIVSNGVTDYSIAVGSNGDIATKEDIASGVDLSISFSYIL